ncbi:MAG: hypothetical protein ACYDD6_05720, partial [Acidimicrobiales bacterium]
MSEGGSSTRRGGRSWGVGVGVVGLGVGMLMSALAATGGISLSAVQSPCTPGLSTISAQPSAGYIYYRGSISSFDCTPIVFNLFEPKDASASHRVYTILEGPGWGSAG